MEAEKQVNDLEIKKDSLFKQSGIQRQQLNDRIKEQEQLLSNEKEVREAWISKYEQEQTISIKVNTELLRLKSSHQELQIQLKNI